jgi:hypothetical protein
MHLLIEDYFEMGLGVVVVLLTILYILKNKNSTKSPLPMRSLEEEGGMSTVLYHTQLHAQDGKTFEQIGREIATVASRINKKFNVTGVLAVDKESGKALQVLEGSKTRVMEILGRICRDQRHSIETILGPQPVAKRYFNDWGMMYANTEAYNLIKQLHPAVASPTAPANVLDKNDMNHIFSEVHKQISEYSYLIFLLL